MIKLIKHLWKRYVLMSQWDRDWETIDAYRKHPNWDEQLFQKYREEKGTFVTSRQSLDCAWKVYRNAIIQGYPQGDAF